MYYQKYIKYKTKYENKKIQNGGLNQDEINEYKYKVYLKSNEIVRNIYNKYKDNILKLFQNGCIQLIDILINKQLDHLFYNFATDMFNSDKYFTGLIHIDNIKSMFKNKEKVFEYLINIRSCFSFLTIGTNLLTKSEVNRISILVSFFDNYIRDRIEKNIENKDIFCLKDIKIPDKLKAKNRIYETCYESIELIENYSIYENYNAIKDIKIGLNLFDEREEHYTIDNFTAGTSGHTFDKFIYFILFMINTLNINNNNMYYYICYGALITMINYYHHSFREILLILTLFIENEELETNINMLYTIRKTNNIKDYNYIFENIEKILIGLTSDELIIEKENISKYNLMNDIINNKYNEELNNKINFIYKKLNKYISKYKKYSQYNISKREIFI